MNWRRLIHRPVVEVGACSHVGQVRSENQDAFGVFPEEGDAAEQPRLFVVADGMGGHAHGREASHMAVDTVRCTFFEESDADVEARLRRALETANRHIYTRSQNGASSDQAGTTCTALARVDGDIYLGHVGDSRAFLLRDGRLHQLTTDHTWVAEMEREGLLTAEEARNHPRRHALTRAIGTRHDVEVDVLAFGTPRGDDTFLLCSDGLAPVEEERIEEIVASCGTLQEAAERLVGAANDRGGPDNVTVLLARFI